MIENAYNHQAKSPTRPEQSVKDRPSIQRGKALSRLTRSLLTGVEQRSRDMGDYRRMGHVEQHLGNATLMHQLRDLWRSPRGTVLRIEALALVAIAASFFLATFGSCRRWSNRWILQKGFLAANVLFLSLGTYSIGLMQSSSIKSEMYPIWTVSLLALLCCVDSVTTYSLDSSSQFWKAIYQLCLYVGYVLLMSISTISSDLGNIAVGVLSAITFMKGFHRTLALVLPGRMRSMIRAVPDCWGQEIGAESAESVTLDLLVVHFSLHNVEPRSIAEDAIMKWDRGGITLREIYSRLEDNDLGLDVDALKDVCFSLSLSHLLQRRFLGFNRVLEIRLHDNLLVSSWILLKKGDGSINYDRAFKVVELELAFLYDVLFTSNAFLHYYETKTANFWAVTSVAGICFVGVVVAIPWARTTAHTPGGTIVTTTGDLVITGVILVSLALLQILQLLNSWTSNWARVAFACDRVRNQKKGISWQMRLRLSLSKINWFRKNLWQNRLGQYSLVESISTRECNLSRKFKGCLYQAYSRFSGTLGLHYFEQMLQEMWGNSTGDAIGLHADVKASIAEYVSRIRSHHVSLLDARRCLDVAYDLEPQEGGTANKYARHLLAWHIATCYCELAQQHDDKGFLNEHCTDSERATLEKNHRVATALSKYCAYLVVSVPRLLPGPYMEYKYTHDEVAGKAGEVLRGVKDKLGSTQRAVKMGFLGRAKYHLCEIRRLISECRETLHSAMDDIAASEGRYYESELRDKVWKRWNTTTGREVQFWQLLKDELDAMENKNRSGVMGMEDGRQALLQVKDEVERAAIERERGRGEVSSWVFDCLRPGAALLQVQEKLAALIKENERIAEALRSAIDKVDAVEKEMETRGAHLYNPDAGLGSRTFYSGLYLGYRLWSQPAPERWKKLADLWVRALVFAAPSDNAEEHMQRLLQGGEFITHLWALFYHHGILRWHEEEIEYDYVFWPTQGEEGATRIYAGGDGSREPYEYY